MNIQALSRTELNRAMIWLYPPRDSVIYNGSIDMYMARYRSMDYLSSWDLTMPLAVENELIIGPMNNSMWPDWWEARNNKAIGLFSFHENPLRAICEVLVMIRMEGK